MGTEEPPEPRPFRFSRNTSHETRITAFMFFTNHETRLFFALGARRAAQPEPPSGPMPPPASRCFPVRHCSPLFTIVRHCSAKKYCPAPVSSRRRSLLSCALSSGMGRLWRGMGGRRPSRRQHGLLGFHESRNTNHESRHLCFPTHDFPRFPGISRPPPPPPGQGSARRSHRQHGRSGFLRDTNHESRPFFAFFDPRMVRHAGQSQHSCRLCEVL